MSRAQTNQAESKYYRLPFLDGLEAMSVRDHKTAFPAHYHQTYNITLVYSGTFKTRLNDKLVLAPTGTILITNPHEVHANPVEKGDSLCFFTFYIGADLLRYCNNGRIVYFDQNAITDDALFTQLHELSIKLTASVDLSLFQNNFKSAFAALCFGYGTDGPVEAGVDIELFRELLEDDRLEKFSLAEAARNFGVDKYKFIRLFKAETGLSPNNYFIYRRIEKSKQLLAEGRPLLSVAVDLGFYDAAHYANHFKKFTGVSPMGFNAGG